MITEMIRRQAAIVGVVTASPTGLPLTGARVTLASFPQAFAERLAVLQSLAGSDRWDMQDPRPDRAVTSADGRFVFIDLPDGPYVLTATLPGTGSRYGQAQANAIVTRDANGRVALVTVNLAVPATSVSGKVVAPPPPTVDPAPLPEPPIPVVMAEVRMLGSGERAYADGQGRYLLTGLETGNRVMTVTSPGHAPAVRPVSLTVPGASPKVDVTFTADEWTKADPNQTRSAANG